MLLASNRTHAHLLLIVSAFASDCTHAHLLLIMVLLHSIARLYASDRTFVAFDRCMQVEIPACGGIEGFPEFWFHSGEQKNASFAASGMSIEDFEDFLEVLRCG